VFLHVRHLCKSQAYGTRMFESEFCMGRSNVYCSENLAYNYLFFTPVFGRVLYYGCDLCHAGTIQALITHKPSLAKPPLLDIEGAINRREFGREW